MVEAGAPMAQPRAPHSKIRLFNTMKKFSLEPDSQSTREHMSNLALWNFIKFKPEDNNYHINERPYLTFHIGADARPKIGTILIGLTPNTQDSYQIDAVAAVAAVYRTATMQQTVKLEPILYISPIPLDDLLQNANTRIKNSVRDLLPLPEWDPVRLTEGTGRHLLAELRAMARSTPG